MSLTSISWAFTILQDLGYQIQNPVLDKFVGNEFGRAQRPRRGENQDGFHKLILKTPWSSVYRFDTDQSSLYLKQVPPGLSKEPHVIHLLQETCGAPVPLVVANNPHYTAS